MTASPDWIPEGVCQEVRFFSDHWLRLKGESALPACELIDPLDFSHYLSRVLLVDYTHCLKGRKPVYHTGKMNWRPRGSELSYQRILMPFGSEQMVERILGFAQFFDTEGEPVFTR